MTEASPIAPQKSSPSFARLPPPNESNAVPVYLTKGYIAWVDFCDLAATRFLWCATVAPNGRVYACSRQPSADHSLIQLHRFILGVTNSAIDVDHRDGDGLDNRRGNLFETDRAGNMHNCNRNKPGKLLPQGVHFEKYTQRYDSYITVNGVRHRLGRYRTIDEAFTARMKAEELLWGIQPRRAHLYG